MPKTVSLTWREYRRLLNATREPDNYRNRLAGLKKDLLRQDSIIVELRQRLSDLQQLRDETNDELRAELSDVRTRYDNLYVTYQQLRDKANDGLLTAAPQIEGLQRSLAEQATGYAERLRTLQAQLVAERNGNAALQVDRNRLGVELQDARRRLAVAGDLDKRCAAVVDAETRVTVALRLAQDMYDLASSMGRSVRPNRPVAPFPNFEQLVRDAKRADSDGKELD